MIAPTPANDQFAPPVAQRIAEARRSYAEARRECEQNAASADLVDALRASPDFAPAFAEPGEMTARERTEEALAERGYVPILAGFGIAAAVATIAIIAVAIARGNL